MNENKNIDIAQLNKKIESESAFIDLLRFLANSSIKSISKSSSLDYKKDNDTFTINLIFNNGSTGTIHYFANGNKSFPKERLEVFNNGNHKRDFTYIDEVIHSIVKILKSKKWTAFASKVGMATQK